jgi:hypothetical protein
MNRQVGPSILLSILIVGFFAVALFQRDPGRPTRPGSAARGPIAAPAASRQSSGYAVFSSRDRPSQTANSALGPGESPTRAASPIPSAAAKTVGPISGGAVLAPTHSPRENLPQSGGEPMAARVADSSGPTFRTASAQTTRPGSGASSKEPAGARQGLTAAPRRPRSAFTVVESNESIEDVAQRVYGSTREVDALWRANRDALPRQDSPLSSGTLLRTPTLR